MRNMSKKTWKLRVWGHMTEMQKLDYLLTKAGITHEMERRFPENDKNQPEVYGPGALHDGGYQITVRDANGKAFAQVIRRPDGSREDLYFEDYELQKDTLIKPNAKLRDVVELCMNGDISYVDVREWCMENDISLGQFDRWLYGALRKSDTPSRVKPKEPWPYRVVAGLNRVLEILLDSILEDFI